MDLWSIEELAGPAFFQMEIEECEGVPLKRALSTFILNYEVEKREKEKREKIESIPFEEWVVDFVIRVQHMVFMAKRNSSSTVNPLELLYGCLLIATKLYLDDLSYYTTLNQFHQMINYSPFTKERIKKAESMAFGLLLMNSSWNLPVFLGTRDDAFRSRLRLLSHSNSATKKTPVAPRSCLKPPPLPLKKKSKKTLFSYFDKKDRT